MQHLGSQLKGKTYQEKSIRLKKRVILEEQPA